MKFSCNVRKKSNGSYEARITIDRKDFSASSKVSSAAAVNKLKMKVVGLEEKKNSSSGVTYGNWLQTWYQTYKAPNLKASSLYGIDVIIRLHIPVSLKNKTITSIRSSDLLQALNSVENSRTRQLVHCVFTDSFDKAFKNEIIEKDVSQLLDPVVHKKKIGQALTFEEREAFLDKIKGHKAESFFKFCLFSGCRRTEALSLRQSDIDFNKNIIKIRGTKTPGSFRIIPIFEDLKELLQKIVFSDDDNIFDFKADYVTKTFHKICPKHKLHDLRHTFATRAMECGISLPVVSKWLGHSNINTTARVYTHVLDQHQFQEARKLKMF